MKNGFLGIISPLPAEGRAVLPGRWGSLDGFPALRSVLPEGKDVLLLSPGTGEGRAGAAARALVCRGAGALAVVGVCGGLHPQVRPGDLVIAGEILREGKRAHAAAVREAKGVWKGALVTGDAPVLSAAAKGELFRRTAAVGVDLESAAVEEIAREADLPFGAVRAVCDPPWREVPPPLAALLTAEGRVGGRAFFLLLLRRFDLIPRMLQLAADFAAARRGLSRALPYAGAIHAGRWRERPGEREKSISFL